VAKSYVVLLGCLALSLLIVVEATNTFAQAVAYVKSHPTNNGGTWAGWCAALMFRCGDLPGSSARPNAIGAYRASHIQSTNWNTAKPGCFHWWDIGSDGHVAMQYSTAGWAMMASNKVIQSWGNAIGVTPLDDYTRKTGGRYLGWSYDYAGAELVGVRTGGGPDPVGPPGNNTKPGPTSTATDGIPGKMFYARMQYWASFNGYRGPFDGVMGTNSWAGVQRGLRAYGYNGPADGVPGTNTYIGMQRVAQKFGYTGPLDGVMGKNSYIGFAKFLNSL